MIPNQPVEGCPQSESEVFQALASNLPSDWIVIHSRRFVLPAVGRHTSKECEVDFLIFHPKRGFLGLEVKGGKDVGRDQDGWYSVDYYGNKHRIKDPGAQAQRATHFVGRYLKQRPDFSNWVPPYGWGVCFPAVTVGDHLDPALPRSHVIDNTELANIRQHLERVFESNSMPDGLIPKQKINAFLKAMAPSFKLAPSLASRFDSERPVLVQMTDEQNDVLDLFEEFPRVAVKGAAGTGKTLVAMEKARRLSAAGKRVILLCFNRPLADHLATLADGFVVETFHKFAKDLARRADITFKEPQEDRDKERFWNEDAADLLDQALNVYQDERFDAVIIDEAQDFKPLWWLPIETLLRDGRNGTLYIFYDPNQQIYGDGPAAELDMKSTTLKYNCRNTKLIAEYSSQLVDIEAILKPGTPTGTEVVTRACSSERDMVDAVRKLLHEVVTDNKIPTAQIVVLTTSSPSKSPVFRARKLGNLSLVRLDQQPNKDEVRFSTLHRFKGLEADVVILCDVKPENEESTAKHLYVGTSRARHMLAVCRYSH
jgi:ATP:corrinoid adenosyltransferase